MELYRQSGLDQELDAMQPAVGIPPGKTTLTSRLAAPSIVFRVADANTARVLGEAMTGSRGLIQREVEPGAGRDGNGVAADAEAAVDRAASGGGEPLRADLRERFESSLGADLSAVRIHHSAASAEANAAVGARAYAVGNEIHFGAGQYRPDDPFGIHLLAHEVAHTVQQAGAAPQRQHKLEVSTPGDACEVEADRAADAMVRGERAAIGSAPAHVARDSQGNPDAGPPETATKGTMYVKADGTKVVDRAGMKSTDIDTLGAGTAVQLTHDAGNHYKIITPSGKPGYVLKSQLDANKPAPKEKEKEPEKTTDKAEAAPEKIDEKAAWTAPTADSVPHVSMDPRVRKEKPASADKVWNPPPPVGWHYFPAGKTPPRQGKLLCDEQKSKTMGTFLQVVLEGKLYAVRTEWHNGTVLKDPDTGQWFTKSGVYNGANLMMPDEQPKELPKQAQPQADPGTAPKRQYKMEVSTPGDAHEVEADRAADAMVRGERAAIGSAHAHVARDHDGQGDPDAGPPVTARTGTGYVKADGTPVVDGTGSKPNVIETLAKDATVKLTHDAGNYYKVLTESGKAGYVQRSQINLTKKAAEPAKEAEGEKKAPGTAALKVPNGLAEIIEVFGKPGTNLGMHELACGPKGKVQSVYCHNKVAPLLKAVFDNIVKDGKAEHLHYFSGCYNDRDKVGGTGKSAHAWGIAVDINPEGNARVATDTPADKVPVSESQKIIAPYFEAQGFVWGKAFGDSMHFQYCTGY